MRLPDRHEVSNEKEFKRSPWKEFLQAIRLFVRDPFIQQTGYDWVFWNLIVVEIRHLIIYCRRKRSVHRSKIFQDHAEIFQDLAKILQVLGRSSKKSKIEFKILSRYPRWNPRSCQDIHYGIQDLTKKSNLDSKTIFVEHVVRLQATFPETEESSYSEVEAR